MESCSLTVASKTAEGSASNAHSISAAEASLMRANRSTLPMRRPSHRGHHQQRRDPGKKYAELAVRQKPKLNILG